MSLWGATVITNARGRKALWMSRLQGNNLISDKDTSELSSFQVAKKILWEPKQVDFNDNQDNMFNRDVSESCCISGTCYLTDANSVERYKTSTYLRDTIVNSQWTHATTRQQILDLAMDDPKLLVEGRPERTLNNIVERSVGRTLQCNPLLGRKGTRLFTTKVESESSLVSESQNSKLDTADILQSSDTFLINSTNIYKVATTKDNLLEAFKALKARSVPGVDGETKVGFTKQLDRSILKLHKDLKNHRYKPSPIKIVHIPKPRGGKRPLGISSVRDKIVQSTFKREIEKIYEPFFRKSSFGFRPKLSCHSALKQIKKKWQAIKWIISLDISKFFDKIQHETLISVLKKKITDKETIDLIQKLLNVGYIDIHNLTNRERYKTEGTPQGSIISPLLGNIYLHELDEFIEDELIPKYTIGDKRVADKAKLYRTNNVLKHELKLNPIIEEYPKLKEIIPILKKNKQIKEQDSNYYKEGSYYKRLHYVRYADDILLGVVGNKEDCRNIVSAINKFLQEILRLELNLDKCSINLAWEKPTEFLGFQIGRYQNKIFSKSIQIDKLNIKALQQSAINSPSLLIPTKKILDRLVSKKYVRKLEKSNRYKGCGVGKLTIVTDKKIVQHFSSIIRGYVNYYICANRRSSLWCVVHVLRESCYLTLAWKHKLKNKKKVIEKFGSKLRIHENGKLVTELYYPESLKTELKFFERGFEGYNTNLDEPIKFTGLDSIK